MGDGLGSGIDSFLDGNAVERLGVLGSGCLITLVGDRVGITDGVDSSGGV